MWDDRRNLIGPIDRHRVAASQLAEAGSVRVAEQRCQVNTTFCNVWITSREHGKA